VVGEPYDVVHAVLSRHLDGAVGGAVVDDQPLDGVEPLDLAGEARQRHGKLTLLVETRDLDDELHAGASRLLNAPMTTR
jgi:hypothetical protein